MSLIETTPEISVERADWGNARGLQTDPNGTILAGHRACFDFGPGSIADSLALDAAVSNLVYGGTSAIITGAFAAGLTAAKGLRFTSSEDNELVRLPSNAFDLSQMDSTPSAMLSFWVKTLAPVTTSGVYQQVAQFAYQTSTEAQWWIDAGVDGSAYRMKVANGEFVTVTNDPGAATLLTMVLSKTGATTANVDFWRNKSYLGRKTPTNAYPLNDPVTNSPYPHIGDQFALSRGAWNGVVHRCNSAALPDTGFDPQWWIDQEYDRNAPRFA